MPSRSPRCHIDVRDVSRFAAKIGLHPSAALRPPAGSRPPAALRSARSICNRLGTALSMLFGKTGKRFPIPVRTAGSGVAGLTFFMSDGSVIKVVEFTRSRSEVARRKTRILHSLRMGSGLAPGGHSIPRAEFMHEIEMTRKAHAMFGNTSRVLRWVILKGRFGSVFGVMQLSKAAGKPLTDAIAGTSRARQLKLAREQGRIVARMHARGFSHGDLHSQNAMVGKGGRITVIDFGRATTRRLVRKYARRDPWESIRLFDVAAPYRDHVRSHSREVAAAFLQGYLDAARASGSAPPRGVDRIPEEYEDLVFDNLDSVLDSVNQIAKARMRRGG